MHVWLLRRRGRDPVEVLAHGEIGGDAAGQFVRSMITEPGIQAECEDGWSYWRWELQLHYGKWRVNKVNVYREF